MDTTIRIYSFGYEKLKTYLFAALFILGNLLLPQLCHLTPFGGPVLLPIYFFTLIGAYKYGIYVGLLTAILSPLTNYGLFGMPNEAMLPIILAKSILLAIFASLFAFRLKKVSIWILLAVILSYQVLGTLFEWAWMKDFSLALQDFRIGFPGMLIQIFGGFFVLKALSKI